MLFAGTDKPIPRKEFDSNEPGISVEQLHDNEREIRVHFTRREVQNIGSTSNCGCDFPWVMFQSGGWPIADEAEKDKEQEAIELINRQELVELLKRINEESVELYGVWAGDYTSAPQRREIIPVARILDSDFRLKERGFYQVSLSRVDGSS